MQNNLILSNLPCLDLLLILMTELCSLCGSKIYLSKRQSVGGGVGVQNRKGHLPATGSFPKWV